MVINHLGPSWDDPPSKGQGPLTKQLLAVEGTFPISLNSPARFTRSAFPKASFRDCLGHRPCWGFPGWYESRKIRINIFNICKHDKVYDNYMTCSVSPRDCTFRNSSRNCGCLLNGKLHVWTILYPNRCKHQFWWTLKSSTELKKSSLRILLVYGIVVLCQFCA